MGSAYTFAHAACLAAQLPGGARVWRGTPQEWSDEMYMLSHVEHLLLVLAWQNSEDAQHKRNYPEHRKTPADSAELERKVAASIRGKKRVDEILGEYAPRGGD